MVLTNETIDFRYKSASKTDRVRTEQYFKWMKGVVNKNKCSGINLIPATISQ
jgi:hypothetical protein